jgi:DNA-binding transcriptional ArsR family regulator
MNCTTFGALAEPTRFQIVELLRESPLSVGEITTSLHLQQPQASKHLRVLSVAGIVEMKPCAQQRVYGLQVEPFKDLDRWLGSYRIMWGEKFARLDSLLEIEKRTLDKFKT